MATDSTSGSPVVDVNVYDDDYTTRRKWAYVLNKHFDTLVLLNGKYVNLEDPDGYYYQYLTVHPDDSFLAMYEDLINQYPYVFVLDVIMSYVTYVGIEEIGIDNTVDWSDLLEEFSVIDTKRKYESAETFKNMYNQWELRRLNELPLNQPYYDLINTIQGDLAKVEDSYALENTVNKFVSSTFVSTNISIVINPTGPNGEKVLFSDGINIFDGCRVSKRVPYVKYNDSNRSHYKIYSGNSLVDVPNYDNIDIPDEESNLENMIYLKLWIEDTGFLSKASKKDFVKVTYNLKYNTISFTLPEITKNIKEDEAIHHLRECFSNILLDKVDKVDVKGRFNIFSYEKSSSEEEPSFFPISFDEYSLLDAVETGLDPIMRPDVSKSSEDNSKSFLDDPRLYLYLMGSYFYLDEVKIPFADKLALKLNYRSLSSGVPVNNYLLKDRPLQTVSRVTFELVSNKTGSEESYTISDTDDIVEMPSELDYIQVNVSAKNEADLIRFIRLIKILLYVYDKNKEQIQQEYEDILGSEFISDLNSHQKKYKEEDAPDKNITRSRRLKKLDNDIFVSDYPKLCPRVPISIDADQVEYWKQQYVSSVVKKDDGTSTVVQKPRQVLSFPKDNPKYHFVCDDNAAPYIGLVRNTLSNKDEYPRLPCCYQTDHQIPTKATEYNREYGNVKSVGKGKGRNLIKGRFILLPDQYGELPTKISEALMLHSKKPSKFHRYGVTRSTNSLIHCLCKATSDTRYVELERIINLVERENALEDHVRMIRESLIESVNIFKQEIYDKTDDQIREAIWENTIFLDPALFYRGVEDIFGVNIFVFVPETQDSDEGDIEIPRSWLFHATSYKPEKPTVLIYKHSGSSRDTSEYPQCELIVQSFADGYTAVYGVEMYNVCYQILIDQIKTLTWTPTLTNDIDGNTDIYSGFNYHNAIGNSAFEQYIDSYGKCRALNFKVSSGDTVTIITPPMQPENLPLMDITKVSYVNHTIATMIFGNPSKIDIIDGYAMGLWFKIYDVNEGIYVPIDAVLVEELGVEQNVQAGNTNPVFGYHSDKAIRYSKLKKTITVVLELYKWVYEIYKLQNNVPDGDVANFFAGYVVSDTHTGDSIDYYDLSKIEYKLPFYDNVDDALEYISNNSTGLVVQKEYGRVIMAYDKSFYDQLFEFLGKYNSYTEGLPGNPAKYISEYFQTIEDYTSDDTTMIFLGSKGYRQWLERMIYGPFKIFAVNNDVSLDKAKLTLPYIIQGDQKYYIVQNVQKGEYARAVAVALEWIKSKTNPGFKVSRSEEVDLEQVGIIVYAISTKQSVVQYSKANENMPKVIEILQYGDTPNERYAAMLPLN